MVDTRGGTHPEEKSAQQQQQPGSCSASHSGTQSQEGEKSRRDEEWPGELQGFRRGSLQGLPP